MTRNYLDILADTIRDNWDYPALTDFYLTGDGNAQDVSRGNHYTFGELYAEIASVADLLTCLGLQKGDHIAICGANSAHWVIAFLAIAKMQGVSVTIMHALRPDQIAQMIDFSDAKALFVDKELWMEFKEQSLPQIQSAIALEDWNVLCGDKISINDQSPITSDQCQFVHGNPDELAMICFTSGSTGNPKGVMLPYRSISANVAYLFEYYCDTVKHRNSMLTFPLSHSFAFLNECIKPLCVGMNVNVIQEINREKYVQYFQLINPAYIDMVPNLFEMIIETHVEILMSKDLREIFIGGAGIKKELGKKIEQFKLPVTIGYGATECGPIISATLPNKYVQGSAGRTLPTLKACIAPNGEILVKGDNVMLGYYKDPEATAAKIDAEGWLHTGDKGHLDEGGYLYVEGRLEQDIIVLPNGENIRPDNIESLINALPEVKESIVLARDGKLVAIVVPQITNDQSPMTNTDLRRMIMRKVNPQLPLFSQLYDVEITDQPLARTEKQTIKRYLYH